VRLADLKRGHHPAGFTFAHRALGAAAILLRPAAEIVRFGVAVFCFAQRAFCARLILLRAAADIVRDVPFELTLPSAASAASMHWTSFCARSLSLFNCWTTPDMVSICACSSSMQMIAGIGEMAWSNECNWGVSPTIGNTVMLAGTIAPWGAYNRTAQVANG
jgi:hypothetical protein